MAVSLYVPKCSDPFISGQHQAVCHPRAERLLSTVQEEMAVDPICSIPLLQPHLDQASPCCLWGMALTDWGSVWPGFTLWISIAPKRLREVCVSTDSAWRSLSMCLHLLLSLFPGLRCCETKYERANYSLNCEYINFSMLISNIVLISDFCI